MQHWFGFRANFLWRFMPPKRILEGLETHFGTRVVMVLCPCGVALSLVISRFQLQGNANCPNCGRTHENDVAQATSVDLSERPSAAAP